MTWLHQHNKRDFKKKGKEAYLAAKMPSRANFTELVKEDLYNQYCLGTNNYPIMTKEW